MRIMSAFSVTKRLQEVRNLPFRKLGNTLLLWHGSRTSNIASILKDVSTKEMSPCSQGLKIAPPEAPITGHMFGKGLYFTSISSKAANYCHPSQENSDVSAFH